MTNAPPILIIGAGGHGRSVLDVASSSGVDVLAFVDEQNAGQTIMGVDVLASVADISLPPEAEYFVAIGDNYVRQKVVDKTGRELPDTSQAKLIHQSAYVSPYATVAPGSVVMGQAFVGPNCCIEEGCILNTGSQIDHDGHMRSFSSLGPRACLGGSVNLGKRSVVAIGATVKHGVVIGDDSVLGAQAYLHQSMPEQVVYMGVPARLSSTREVGDKYL